MSKDIGRDPTGQALAVPATPANAVDGPTGFDPSRIAAVARSIRHYLNHKLEGFSNGQHYPPSSPANKTNGYVAAKVPDWQLRQWLDAIATEAQRAETTEIGSVHEGAGPKDIAKETPHD